MWKNPPEKSQWLFCVTDVYNRNAIFSSPDFPMTSQRLSWPWNVPQITYDVPCQIWKNDTPVSGLGDQIYQHWLTLPEIWKNQQTYKYQHGEYMGLNGTQNVSLRWFPNHTVIPQNNFVYDPWLKSSSMISKPPDPNTWSWYFVKSEFHYSTRLFFNQCNQSSIQRVKVLMQPKFYNIYHTTWWKPNHYTDITSWWALSVQTPSILYSLCLH